MNSATPPTASLPSGSARLSVAIATFLAAAVSPAQTEVAPAADAGPIEELVVTAAGFQQKLSDAPASISVVSAVEVAQRPYMTLVDAVRDLEGVDIGETSDKTGQRTISMRGMGSE